MSSMLEALSKRFNRAEVKSDEDTMKIIGTSEVETTPAGNSAEVRIITQEGIGLLLLGKSLSIPVNGGEHYVFLVCEESE